MRFPRPVPAQPSTRLRIGRAGRRLLPTTLALSLSLALAAAAGSAWADDDDDSPPPRVGTPVAPVLPALGSFSKASVSAAAFRGCADYSMGGLWASDASEPGRKTAVCNDTVYARADITVASTTKGERVGAVVSGSNAIISPNANASSSADGWRNASGAGASATANLQKEGHVLNLKVGAQARNARDALFNITPTFDAASGTQDGWTRGSSNGVWWLEDGIYTQGAGAVARIADKFVVKGTGTLTMTFTVDGFFEKGDSLAFDDGGGKFSFAAGLFNPQSLLEFDVGGDDGKIRVWQQADFGGFALGRDRRDSPFTEDPFLSAEELLGSRDFYAPGSSVLPSEQLPNEPTFTERSVTLSLPAVDGQTLWLVVGMWASAGGWNPCDPVPGDGDTPNAAVIVGPDDELPSCGGRTVIDFTSTAKLTSVVFEGGITGLQSESGVDYQLAVAGATVPIPEPGTYALMALGLAAVLTAARRRGAREPSRSGS